MADEKNTPAEKPEADSSNKVAADWAESMKEAMEEYIEEQGIYIRQ